MRYRVIGADEVSGEAMELIVEAESADEARFKATARGIRAERVEEADAPPAPPAQRAAEREERAGGGPFDADSSSGEGANLPEGVVWVGGPSQWWNAPRFLGAAIAAVALVLGAIYIPKWLGMDRTVWIAVLIAIALPAIYAFYVWLRTRSHRYRVTNERLVIRTGILTRHVEEIELYRIIDAEPRQTLVQRMLRVGRLTLRTTDASMPTVVLDWLPDHLALWDKMRPLITERRKRHRILEGVGEI